MAERAVVRLERGEVDEPDCAPPAALLESEERLELFGEAPEVHQLRLRIAMRLVCEIGDELFEVARDTADRGVARRQLVLHLRHLVREARRQRLNRFVLRLLPQALMAREHGIDGAEQCRFDLGRQTQLLAYPRLKFRACLGSRAGRGGFFRAHHRNPHGCRSKARVNLYKWRARSTTPISADFSGR